jgi:hypothetical protein
MRRAVRTHWADAHFFAREYSHSLRLWVCLLKTNQHTLIERGLGMPVAKKNVSIRNGASLLARNMPKFSFSQIARQRKIKTQPGATVPKNNSISCPCNCHWGRRCMLLSGHRVALAALFFFVNAAAVQGKEADAFLPTEPSTLVTKWPDPPTTPWAGAANMAPNGLRKSTPLSVPSTAPNALNVSAAPLIAPATAPATSISTPLNSQSTPSAADQNRWEVRPSDITLSKTLERWAAVAGAPDVYVGSFEGALQHLLSSPGIRLSDFPLEACIYANTPPLVRITRQGEQTRECAASNPN